MLNFSVKCDENISKCFQVTDRIWIYDQNHYLSWSNSNNFKNRKTKVKVLVFSASSYGAIQFCKVSWIYLKQFFKLWVGHKFLTKITFYNVPKAINPKTGKQQLWFLRSVRRLIGVNISVKVLKISPKVSGNDFMINKRDLQLNSVSSQWARDNSYIHVYDLAKAGSSSHNF